MPRHFPARFITIPVLIIIFGLISPCINALQPPAVAVIYPDLQEPYRSVLSSIIEGIEEQSKAPVKLFAVEEGLDYSRLKEPLNHKNISVIVALGRTG